MKNKLIIILVLMLSFMGCATPKVARNASTLVESRNPDDKIIRRGKLVSNSYIVVFKDDANKTSVLNEHRSKVIKRKSYNKVLKGLNLRLSNAEADALSQDDRVLYIEQDRYIEPTETQSNPPWGLDRIDQRNLPLDATFNYTNTGLGVNIYIIDSGIYYVHNEFDGRAVPFFDAIQDGQNGNDCFGHGTHVAATAAGETYGVAKQATIRSARVMNCLGQGQISDIIAAIDAITATGPRPAVANMSFVFAGDSPAVDTALYNSMREGVSYVAAAGNNAYDACEYGPAMNPNVITVGATWDGDGRWLGSNYGSCVTLFAPGFGIVAAHIGSPDAVLSRSGTSMAAPFATGVAALYLNTVPYANMSMVKNAVVNNTTNNVLTEIGANSPNKLLHVTYGTGSEPQPTPFPTVTQTTTPAPTATPCPSPKVKGKPCK